MGNATNINSPFAPLKDGLEHGVFVIATYLGSYIFALMIWGFITSVSPAHLSDIHLFMVFTFLSYPLLIKLAMISVLAIIFWGLNNLDWNKVNIFICLNILYLLMLFFSRNITDDTVPASFARFILSMGILLTVLVVYNYLLKTVLEQQMQSIVRKDPKEALQEKIKILKEHPLPPYATEQREKEESSENNIS